MSTLTEAEKKLAINGGSKAKTTSIAPYHKVHIEELLELISLWGVKPETQRRVAELIRPEVTGPHLFRYYTWVNDPVYRTDADYKKGDHLRWVYTSNVYLKCTVAHTPNTVLDDVLGNLELGPDLLEYLIDYWAWTTDTCHWSPLHSCLQTSLWERLSFWPHC